MKNPLKPLSTYAFNLIVKIISKKQLILFSDFIVKELKVKYDILEIEELFTLISNSGFLKKVEITKEDFEEADKLADERNVAFGDALHAILARNHNAILITRDAHFNELKDIVEVKKPEEVI